jgi:hypothetical protein
MSDEQLDLWGEKMKVRHSEVVKVQGNDFPLHEVTASDDTRAVVMICSERIAKDTSDVLSVIEHVLATHGLLPTFVKSRGHLFLESVSPLDTEIMQRFRGQRAGIVALVNGHEPGQGAHALDEMTLHEGDKLDLLYRVGSAESDSRTMHSGSYEE